jgi:hypothetical protein
MRWAVAPCALLLAAGPLHGQHPRLDGRLDAETRHAVLALADSARLAGLPVEPLIQKALEGESKGADGARITAAVRALLDRLYAARAALGGDATEAELVAGAAALYVGVAPERLERLRKASPGERLALPLVALADLVQRGVPPDTAAVAIEALARARSGEVEYRLLRQLVEQDIRAGAVPAAAALERARAITSSRQPGTMPRSGAGGPEGDGRDIGTRGSRP